MPHSTDIHVFAPDRLSWLGNAYRCALGRAGLTNSKREGDGATPIGKFALRRVYFRPDRLGPVATDLPVAELRPDDGWCDDPADAAYNRLVKLPFPASHEMLWRDDGLYDVIVELGYNDTPVVAGMGSAIFMHVARSDYGPTEGCVALQRGHLLSILAACGADTFVEINYPPA